MEEIRIEALREEHLADVAKIESECFFEPWSENSLRLLLEDNAIAFVALAGDGRAVAYGAMLCVLDEGQITNVATLSDYRRRGIAERIMKALAERGAERGISSFTLEVRATNEAARRLYAKLGWQELGVRRGFYRFPMEDAIVMRKTEGGL